MRVFISSTVFDLIDVRAELKSELELMGIEPVMSDEKLSGFAPNPDENSIRTCLTNLESCDEAIVILDRRYGHRIGDFGFEHVSATHLEYRHAADKGIPVSFFVRDRLDSDYSIWKRNGREDSVSLVWVKSEDFGLFEFMDERFQAAPEANNWRWTFSNSCDLKASIRKQFEARILPQRVIELLAANQFPILKMELDVALGNNRTTGNGTLSVTNIGGSPAFDFRLAFPDEVDERSPSRRILAPGQTVDRNLFFQNFDVPYDREQICMLSYSSAIGVSVVETYRVNAYMTGDGILIICERLSQTFHAISKPEISIESSPLDPEGTIL